jgi:hypothetical protein
MRSAKRSSWDVRAVAEAAVVDFVDCLNAPAPRQADAGQGRSLRPVKAESQPEPTIGIGLFEIAHSGKFTRLQPSCLGAAQGRETGPLAHSQARAVPRVWGKLLQVFNFIQTLPGGKLKLPPNSNRYRKPTDYVSTSAFQTPVVKTPFELARSKPGEGECYAYSAIAWRNYYEDDVSSLRLLSATHCH